MMLEGVVAAEREAVLLGGRLGMRKRLRVGQSGYFWK
jgi:hypothetical protein